MRRFTRALFAATAILAMALGAVAAPPPGLAQNPRPTPGPRPTVGRPTAEANQSECAGYITSTVSTSSLRVCDTLTTTVQLVPQCPFCLGGISIVFVQPAVAGITGVVQNVNDQMLRGLEAFQRDYERTFNHTFLIQAGVVEYTATTVRVIQPMTTRLSSVRAALGRVTYGLNQDGGPYDDAAQEAVKLLRSAARTSEAKDLGGHEACLEFIAFYGSREGSTEDVRDYTEKVLSAASIMRSRTRSYFVGCTARDTMLCGFFYYMQNDNRYLWTVGQSQTKFRSAMESFLHDTEDQKPAELVREISLSQRLPAGLAYEPGSGSPPPSTVMTGTDGGTELRWEFKPVQIVEAYTVSYRVKPNQEGLPSIEGGFELRDIDGLRRTVPMAAQPITVTGLCLTPTPTPTDTPTPTETPEPTATRLPSPTPTATHTPQPTSTPRPSPTPTLKPRPVYLPLVLVESCKPQQQRVDVAMVMDTSTSMAEKTGDGRSKLAAAQEAARTLLDELQFAAGDHAALITFNHDATLAQPLTGDRAALDRAITAMTLAPTTCLVCGIERADEELHGPRRQQGNAPILILLTDGRSNPRPVEEAIARARSAKAGGVLIFTIGIGNELDIEALAAIASQPDYFFRSADAQDLNSIYRSISRAIPCQPDAYWGRR